LLGFWLMKLTVVVAWLGRPEILGRMLSHMQHQTRKPDVVILSTPDASHLPASLDYDLHICAIHGPKGLPAQSNTALTMAVKSADVDDVFLPATIYLSGLTRAYQENPDYAVIHGLVIADGANNAGYSFEDGIEILKEAAALGADVNVDVRYHIGAYGCNTSFRSEHVGNIRFDERLVLYAFIEIYGVKYDKAVACLTKDRDALFAFYDFPAEHWKHLRTTNRAGSKM